MIGWALGIILAVSAGASQQGPGEGVLCVFETTSVVSKADGVCVPVESRQMRVPASSEPRRYLWFAGGVIAAGLVEPEADLVDLSPGDGVTQTALRILGSDLNQWPADVEVTLTDHDGPSSNLWRWHVSADELEEWQTLVVPQGSYEISVGAEHHETWRGYLATGQKVLPAVVLRRFPVVRGGVVDHLTRIPVFGATVSVEEHGVLAVTDGMGEFAAEISDEWPTHLRIESAGYGTKWVEIPKKVSDATLGAITLRTAGGLRVTIDAPTEVVEMKLVSLLPDRVEKTVIEREVRLSEGEIEIDDLAPGEYMLKIKGPGEFQRVGLPVTIKAAGTARRTIDVRPCQMTLSVRGRRGPIPNARVKLINHDGGWQSDIELGDQARATIEIWQRGSYGAYVTVPGAPATFNTQRNLPDAEERVDWPIEVGGHWIHGIVLEERGREPVGNAPVLLVSEYDNGGGGTKLLFTESAGRFEVSFLPPGQHTITVDVPGYLEAHRSLILQEHEGESVDVEILLTRGVRKVLQVADTRGLPIAGAVVVDPQRTYAVTTSADGTATVMMAERDQRNFVILPREGSFATVTISASDDRDRIAVAVPDGNASLTIRTESESGQPIPNVPLAVRYNGLMMTYDVLEAMRSQQSLDFRTSGSGERNLVGLPPGMYEFWPISGYSDLAALVTAPSAPPAAIGLKPGLNTVVMTLARDH